MSRIRNTGTLDEEIWLHRYEPELENVRAAMEWATLNDRELAVALFGSAWPLLVETDLHAEARTRYSQVLTLLSDALPKGRIGRGSGKRSPPTIRRGNAIVPVTQPSSRRGCMPQQATPDRTITR